jgi:hypothetical protein
MTQTQTKPLIQRVHEFFQDLAAVGLFDHMSNMSDVLQRSISLDEINSLCDAVAAAAKAEPKLYTLQMWGCVEPSLFGPYTTEDERVAAVKLLRQDDNNSEEDSYCRIDVDLDGVPTTCPFTNGEFDGDSDEETD